MIVDEVKIHLKAGRGGSGSSAFFKKGGYKIIGWGGDGGRGGSIILKVSLHLYDLSKFSYKKEFAAQDGKCGLSNNKTGRSGSNLLVEIPPGTLVRNLKGDVIVDMLNCNDTFEIAKGGGGGRGNYRGNHPREGLDGDKLEVILDYRIPNDVAILGLPNSGKTSLFNILTNKNYKVASYPFTTTSCVWASCEYDFKKFTILDLPALTEASHRGKGLGNRFLRHLWRTKILLFVSDNLKAYNRDMKVIEDQLNFFDNTLLKNKNFFYLLTKTDKIDKKVKGSFTPISSKSCVNIDALKKKIIEGIYYEENSGKGRQ